MGVDTSQKWRATKISMRSAVLDAVPHARVLDLFCGVDWASSMWAAVWQRAEAYLGCDWRWAAWDPRRRMVGRNRALVDVLDLQAFNVFDLDAYGSPIVLANMIARRRTWARGERGALVLTDGAHLKARMSGVSEVSLALGLPPTGTQREGYRAAVADWMTQWGERSGVREMSREVAAGPAGNSGGTLMLYTSMTFEGR